MNMHVFPDIDWNLSFHERNVASSGKLLALLRKHHGYMEPVKVYLPAIIYPNYVRLGFERAASRDTVIKQLMKPQKNAWFAILHDAPMTQITLRDVERAVCRHFNITRLQLVQKRRQADVVYRRSIAIYLARELTDKSYPAIGRMFGGMDHTSVLAAARRITKAMDSDVALRMDVAAIRSELVPS
jgi:hypothetical protein